MLVSEGRPTIIDLERVALSDPLRDVGNLLAHVIVVARRDLDQAAALLSFGEELSRVSLGLEGRPEGDLAFHVVRGLLEQAILPFRRIEDDWRTGCGELLDLALAQGGSGEERTPSSVSGGRASRVPPCTLDELDTRALRWEVLHPRNGTRWPGRFRDAEGEEVFGVLRRGEGRFQEIHPDEDPLLQPFPDLLQEAELVAYRSGRRATFRVKGEKGPARWVKIVSARRIADLVQRHETFRGVVAMRQPVPLSTARILEKDLERGRLTLSEVEGVPLHDHLLEGNRQREETSLAEVALALARLHEVSGPRVEGLTSSREHRSPSDWLALVAEHYPGLSPSWDEARHRLEPPSTAGHPVAVHGDLHDRNLLVHGSKVGILDLDSSGRGAREEDIGNLVAHLLLRSLQRDGSFEAGRGWTSCFLEAYRSAGSGLAEDALRGWLATALFRLSCVYLFRRRWRTLVPDLLAECERWSSRACSLP
jgi:aminoglycoside phosphotransferase (APT) family kinase protein